MWFKLLVQLICYNYIVRETGMLRYDHPTTKILVCGLSYSWWGLWRVPGRLPDFAKIVVSSIYGIPSVFDLYPLLKSFLWACMVFKV